MRIQTVKLAAGAAVVLGLAGAWMVSAQTSGDEDYWGR